MILHRVLDVSVDEVIDESYDLALFASGYEERCTVIPTRLSTAFLRSIVVLGFEEMADDPRRREHDQMFDKLWPGRTVSVGATDDGPVFAILRRELSKARGRMRILVDYSSMSRLWYSSVLSWARFCLGPDTLEVDLLYAVGDHKVESTKDVREPMVITDIACLPGCEGAIVPLAKSVAIFGLGFEGEAALCVLDRLEPDEVYAFLAEPAAFPHYPQLARGHNEELIRSAAGVFSLPLNSVERTYSALSEVIAPHRARADVTIVPMGPKPQVLASILLAIRFPDIACLRVSGRRASPERVGTTGDVVGTRVQFNRRSQQ